MSEAIVNFHYFDNQKVSTFTPQRGLVLTHLLYQTPMEPGRRYFFFYQIYHKNTGRFIVRKHPTPFWTKPLFGVRDFEIIMYIRDDFNFKVIIHNISYTDNWYRNTRMKLYLHVQYYDNAVTQTRGAAYATYLTDNFDSNPSLYWHALNTQYLGKYLTIRIKLSDLTNNNVLKDITTPRIYIPFAVPVGAEGTRIYPPISPF